MPQQNQRSSSNTSHKTTKQSRGTHEVTLGRAVFDSEISALHQRLVNGSLVEPTDNRSSPRPGIRVVPTQHSPRHDDDGNKALISGHDPGAMTDGHVEHLSEIMAASAHNTRQIMSEVRQVVDEAHAPSQREPLEDEFWRYDDEELQREQKENGRVLRGAHSNFARIHTVLNQEEFSLPSTPVLNRMGVNGLGREKVVETKEAEVQTEVDNALSSATNNSPGGATPRPTNLAVDNLSFMSSSNNTNNFILTPVNASFESIEAIRRQKEKIKQLQNQSEMIVRKARASKLESDETIFKQKKEIDKLRGELEAYRLYIASQEDDVGPAGDGGTTSERLDRVTRFMRMMSHTLRMKNTLEHKLRKTEETCMSLADNVSVTTKSKLSSRWLSRLMVESAAVEAEIRQARADGRDAHQTDLDKLKSGHRFIKTVRPHAADTLGSLCDTNRVSQQVVRALNPHLVEFGIGDSLIGVGEVAILSGGTVPTATVELHTDDTVEALCERFGTTVADILWLNPDVPPDLSLENATVIKIPEPGGYTHTVEVGETIDSVAARFAANPSMIRRDNNITEDVTDLPTGIKLRLVPRDATQWHSMALKIILERRDHAIREYRNDARLARQDLVRTRDRVLCLQSDFSAVNVQQILTEGLVGEMYAAVKNFAITVRTIFQLSAMVLPMIPQPPAKPHDNENECFHSIRKLNEFLRNFTDFVQSYDDSVKYQNTRREEMRKEREKKREERENEKQKARELQKDFQRDLARARERERELELEVDRLQAELAQAANPLSPSPSGTLQGFPPMLEVPRDFAMPPEGGQLFTPSSMIGRTPTKRRSSIDNRSGALLTEKVALVAVTCGVLDLEMSGAETEAMVAELQGYAKDLAQHHKASSAAQYSGDSFLLPFPLLREAVEFAVELQQLAMGIELPIIQKTMLPKVEGSDSKTVIFNNLRPSIAIHYDTCVIKTSDDGEVRFLGESIRSLMCLLSLTQGGQTLLSDEAYTVLPESMGSIASVCDYTLCGLDAYSLVPAKLSERQAHFRRGLRGVRAPRRGLRDLQTTVAPMYDNLTLVDPAWPNPLTVVVLDLPVLRRIDPQLRDAIVDLQKQVRTMVLNVMRELEDGQEVSNKFMGSVADDDDDDDDEEGDVHQLVANRTDDDIMTFVFRSALKGVQFCLDVQAACSTVVIPSVIADLDDFEGVYTATGEEIFVGPRICMAVEMGDLACRFDHVSQSLRFSGQAMRHALGVLALCKDGEVRVSDDVHYYIGQAMDEHMASLPMLPVRVPELIREVHGISVQPSRLAHRLKHLHPDLSANIRIVSATRLAITTLTVVEEPTYSPVVCLVLRFDTRWYPTGTNLLDLQRRSVLTLSNELMRADDPPFIIKCVSDVVMMCFRDASNALVAALQLQDMLHEAVCEVCDNPVPLQSIGIGVTDTVVDSVQMGTILAALAPGGALAMTKEHYKMAASDKANEVGRLISDATLFVDDIDPLAESEVCFLAPHALASHVDRMNSMKLTLVGTLEFHRQVESLPNEGRYNHPHSNSGSFRPSPVMTMMRPPAITAKLSDPDLSIMRAGSFRSVRSEVSPATAYSQRRVELHAPASPLLSEASARTFIPSNRRTLLICAVEGAQTLLRQATESWEKQRDGPVMELFKKIVLEYRGSCTAQDTFTSHQHFWAIFSTPDKAIKCAFRAVTAMSTLPLPKSCQGFPFTSPVGDPDDPKRLVYSGFRLKASVHTVEIAEDSTGTMTFPVDIPDAFDITPGGCLLMDPALRAETADFTDATAATVYLTRPNMFLLTPKGYEHRLANVNEEKQAAPQSESTLSRSMTMMRGGRRRYSVGQFDMDIPVSDTARSSRRTSIDVTSTSSPRRSRCYTNAVAILPNGMVDLIAVDEESVMSAMQDFLDLLRNLLIQYEGMELRNNGHIFIFGFTSVNDAFTFASRAHRDIQKITLPAVLRDHPACHEVVSARGEMVMRGIQLSIGMQLCAGQVTDAIMRTASTLAMRCIPGATRASNLVKERLSFGVDLVAIPVAELMVRGLEDPVESYYLFRTTPEHKTRERYIRSKIAGLEEKRVVRVSASAASTNLLSQSNRSNDGTSPLVDTSFASASSSPAGSTVMSPRYTDDSEMQDSTNSCGEWSRVGAVTYVVIELDGYTNLVATDAAAATLFLNRYHDHTRIILRQFKGYIISCVRGVICAAFTRLPDAVQCSLHMQVSAMCLTLPKSSEISKLYSFSEVKDSAGTVVFRGPRLKIGLHLQPDIEGVVRSADRKSWEFRGEGLHVASRLAAVAQGGCIRILEETLSAPGLEHVPSIAEVVPHVSHFNDKQVCEHILFPMSMKGRADILHVRPTPKTSMLHRPTLHPPKVEEEIELDEAVMDLDVIEAIRRDNKGTVVTISIDSAADLWECNEAAMLSVTSAHTKVVRGLCAKYKGVEIVGVTDAFVLLFTSTRHAFRFAVALQLSMLEVDVADPLDKHVAVKPVLEREVTLFMGLRIKVGIHHGPVSITEKEDTKRMEYSGDGIEFARHLVQTCHGGAIKISRTVLFEASWVIREISDVDVLPMQKGDTEECYYAVPKRLSGRLPKFRLTPAVPTATSENDRVTLALSGDDGTSFESGMNVCPVLLDVEGANELFELDEQAALAVCQSYSALMRTLLERHSGYEVKCDGFAFLLVFRDATNAVKFSLDAQLNVGDIIIPDSLKATPYTEPITSSAGIVIVEGLRLLVSASHGRIRCNLDPRTKRYNFFGRTIMIASKLGAETRGGVITATEDLLALSHVPREEFVWSEPLTYTIQERDEVHADVNARVLFPARMKHRVTHMCFVEEPAGLDRNSPRSGENKSPLLFDPETDMCIVDLDVDRAVELWDLDQDKMCEIGTTLHIYARSAARIQSGHEVHHGGTHNTFAFRTPSEAIQFAMRVQSQMELVKVTEGDLATHPSTQDLPNDNDNDNEGAEEPFLFRGVRTVFGLACGAVACEHSDIVQRWHFAGDVIASAGALKRRCPGGAFCASSAFKNACGFLFQSLCHELALGERAPPDGSVIVVPKEAQARARHLEANYQPPPPDVDEVAMGALSAVSSPRSTAASPRRHPDGGDRIKSIASVRSLDDVSGDAEHRSEGPLSAKSSKLFTNVPSPTLSSRAMPCPQCGYTAPPGSVAAAAAQSSSSASLTPQPSALKYEQRATSTSTLDQRLHEQYVDELPVVSRRTMLQPLVGGRAASTKPTAMAQRKTVAATDPVSRLQHYATMLSDDPFMRHKDQKVTKLLLDLDGSPYQSATARDVNVFRPSFNAKKTNVKLFPSPGGGGSPR
eukprot:PhM_4_TR15949/c0_g1_i2/m.50219